MNRSIRLSEGEWKIMNLLWENAPRTIAQLVSALKEDTGWTKGTVFMMLSCLGKGRGALEEAGGPSCFTPR